jgi:hypothetical protein
MSVKIRGLQQTQKNLKNIEDRLISFAYERALQLLGEKIGELTESELPVDKGLLKASFTVQKVGNQWVCGYNTEYAASQHEGHWPDGSHIKKNFPGGGKLHFLRDSVELNRVELLAYFSQCFANELKKAL